MSQIPGSDAPAEPLLAVGTVTAAATAILALIVSFGVPVSDAQQAAILGVLAVFAPLIVAAAGRAKVYSPHTVRQKLLAEQARSGR